MSAGVREPTLFGDPVRRAEPPALVNGSLAAFETFWLLYPRKIAKGAARVAFARAIQKIAASELIDIIKQYPFDLGRPQYIPYPATWLNQERWEDDFRTPGPQAAPLPSNAETMAAMSNDERRQYGLPLREET